MGVGGTERTRTVIVFVDSEVHTPFCHGPMRIWDFGFRIADLKSQIPNPQSEIELGGPTGLEPAISAFTVRRFDPLSYGLHKTLVSRGRRAASRLPQRWATKLK